MQCIMQSDGGVRAGSTLVEAIAAMTLSLFVLSVIAGIFAAQVKLARAAARNAADAEAVRTVTTVLSAEARRMVAGDVSAAGGDSLVMRAFRGAALLCGTSASGVLVRYRGDRLPEPAKDSVLFVPAAAAPLALLYSAAAPGQCPTAPGETVFEWRLGDAAPPSTMLLLFESGSYHLSTRALRYRLGGAGRQPLTEEALQHPFTRFTAADSLAIRFRLQAGGRRTQHSARFPGGIPR